MDYTCSQCRLRLLCKYLFQSRAKLLSVVITRECTCCNQRYCWSFRPDDSTPESVEWTLRRYGLYYLNGLHIALINRYRGSYLYKWSISSSSRRIEKLPSTVNFCRATLLFNYRRLSGGRLWLEFSNF